MGISLDEAMRIFPFSRAVLRAGKAAVPTAVVESVNIQEVPDVARWLKGGEIVFTAGYAFQQTGEGPLLMKALKKKKVAALAIKPGQCFSEIPPEMLETAEEIQLPLFELPEDLPYMDCMIPILERLTQKRLYALERTEMIRSLLIDAILHGEGLDGITKALESTLGCSVLIMTPQGMLLSRSMHDEADELYVASLKRFCHRMFSDPVQNRYASNSCTKVTDGDRYTILLPISVESEILAVLFVMTGAFEIDSAQLMLLENVGSMVTVELLKEREMASHELQISGQFLEALLSSDSYLDDTQVNRWAAYVGFDISKSISAMVLGLDVRKGLRSNPAITQDELQAVRDVSLNRLRRNFRSYPETVLTMESSMIIIILVSVSSEQQMRFYKRSLEKTVRELREEYGTEDFSAGVGRVKKNIFDAAVSFKEAKKALDAAVRTGALLVEFSSLGSAVILGELAGTDMAKDFCAEHLSKLEEYDEKYNASLVETLSAYLASEKNVRKASELLGIHKNSVMYRLERVEDVLGISLKDSEVCFNLQLSLKLRELGK